MNMKSTFFYLKQKLINSGIFSYVLVKKATHALLRKWRMLTFYQNREVIIFLADQTITPKRPKMFVVMNHIVSELEVKDPTGKGAPKVERLAQTIDGLLASFAHCELKILINTVPDRHIIKHLPAYQQERISVKDDPFFNPLYLGYRAQDELAKHVQDYDWFLYIEDDIVINDGSFLDKLSRFNRFSGYPNAILFPNRYEMYEGKKYYIDLTIEPRLAWDKVSAVEVDGTKFAECSNSHSGLYCLSKTQMEHWIASGRTWNYQDIMVSPLESAGTYCLMECFKIYKPHPLNLSYLEVRHYDTKYSKLYPDPSPFILSAV